jgi:hypothetical protein
MIQAIRSTPLAYADAGGWTVRRAEVVEEAAGICARCGLPGADTATRGWYGEELVAAHTRCVVGLGPTLSSGHLRAA